VFGKVVEGKDVVTAIEKQGTIAGKPNATIIVTSCGEVDKE
jgi:hypothetical protein